MSIFLCEFWHVSGSSNCAISSKCLIIKRVQLIIMYSIQGFACIHFTCRCQWQLTIATHLWNRKSMTYSSVNIDTRLVLEYVLKYFFWANMPQPVLIRIFSLNCHQFIHMCRNIHMFSIIHFSTDQQPFTTREHDKSSSQIAYKFRG